MVEALDIQVQGIVQGVGFRPFVYRMAKKYLVSGWVMNAVDGVFIHAEAEGKLLDEFVIELSENAPAAAQVKEINLKEVPLQDCRGFEIRASSEAQSARATLVSADLATCDDCVAELFNPNDRRYRYPFINCTNCGPRFTIADALPYDRSRTSMRSFAMCKSCAAEYADPADRRFHAQPDACFTCGPHVTLALLGEGDAAAGGGEPGAAGTPGAADTPGAVGVSEPAGGPGATGGPEPAGTPGAVAVTEPAVGLTREASDAIFAQVVELLLAGGIVAVKGLGGFHLVCDARNAQAVARLRAGKRRPSKPFAVMMRSVDELRGLCLVSDVEAKELASPARPIVLVRKKAGAALAAGLADALPELGVMLPATPVQQLLLHDFAAALEARGVVEPPMLVMTSGNVHGAPIVVDDAQAVSAFTGIACAVMGNDRPILSRYDDSVERVVRAGSAGFAVQVVRRARGLAPVPVRFGLGEDEEGACRKPAPSAATAPEVPAAQPALFAVGPEQKATFCYVRGGEAFVSQHIGDLENAETFDAWLESKARFERLFKLAPAALACDAHPDYLASKWAREQAKRDGLPLVEVPHHHAHIASVLGEHGIDQAVCGIAFDGTGFGPDGAVWGGEVLIANQAAFERFANFAYVPMPGGAAAVKNPLRMAYGVLWAFDLLEHPGAQAALAALGSDAATLDQMIERGLNTPMTSSVGRLFDATSALLGLCACPSYEGEAAILLEAALWDGLAGKRAACADGPGEAGDPGVGVSDPAHGAPAFAPDPRYSLAITKNVATAQSTAQDTSVVLFDAAPTFAALLDDLAAGVPTGRIARAFHDAFVEGIVNAARLAFSVYGISTVALSGGVFLNRYLLEQALGALEDAGFTVAVNRELPPGDGCISFGQAVVAWAQSKAD